MAKSVRGTRSPILIAEFPHDYYITDISQSISFSYFNDEQKTIKSGITDVSVAIPMYIPINLKSISSYRLARQIKFVGR